MSQGVTARVMRDIRVTASGCNKSIQVRTAQEKAVFVVVTCEALVQRLKSAKIDENVCRTYESSSPLEPVTVRSGSRFLSGPTNRTLKH